MLLQGDNMFGYNKVTQERYERDKILFRAFCTYRTSLDYRNACYYGEWIDKISDKVIAFTLETTDEYGNKHIDYYVTNEEQS